MPKYRTRAKRKDEARRRAQQPKPDVWPGNFHEARIKAPLPRKRGRPKAHGDVDLFYTRDPPVGGTKETIAKLPADVLVELTRSKAITAEEARAGREIVDAWELIVAGVGYAAASMGKVPGRNHGTSERAERLFKIWEHWAPEMLKRTRVRCFVPVEWIKGVDDDGLGRRWDLGAIPTLKAALVWWLEAAQSVGRTSAPSRQGPPRRQSTLRAWRQGDTSKVIAVAQ